MKKLFLLLPVLAFSVNVLFAQDDELPPPTSKPKTDSKQNAPDEGQFQGFKKPKKVDLSKFIIEPNFNFGIGSGVINLGLSPYVGYNVWKDLYLGGGFTYLYTGYSGLPATYGNYNGTANAHWNTYGGGVFAQYNVWKGFFARAKFEVLHGDIDDYTQEAIPINPNNPAQGLYFPKIQVTTPDLLLGAGYNLLRSKNFFFPIIVSYNLLHSVTNTSYSIYPHGFVVQLGFVNVF